MKLKKYSDKVEKSGIKIINTFDMLDISYSCYLWSIQAHNYFWVRQYYYTKANAYKTLLVA